MNWRRGLLLAAINLAVAVPMILWLDSMEAAFQREQEQIAARTVAQAPPTTTPDASDAQGGGVSFSICEFGELPIQGGIVMAANMPADILADWQAVCPARWSLAGRLHAGGTWSTPSMAAQHKVDIGLILLIAIQWVLVGSFPLVHPKRPWGEPGILITVCAMLSLTGVFFPPIEDIGKLFAAFAALTWLVWFGVLIWKLVRSAWNWTARRLASHAS